MKRGGARPARRASPVVAAWAPLDRALAAYRAGRTDVYVTSLSDVGEREDQDVAVFFRTYEEMPAVERAAVDSARGTVLDLGAGAGAHAVTLLDRGLAVTAAEPLPAAARILRERGVPDVREGGLDALPARERFDTILLLMNGLGLAGTLGGVPAFLEDLEAHLAPGGQVLADSTDPRDWEDPGDGRYRGEIHYQIEFEGVRGAPFPLVFLDSDTLSAIADSAGWRVEVLVREGRRYLARLTVRGPS